MATREEEAAEAIDDEGRFEAWFLGWFATLARAMALVVRDFGDGQEIAQEAFLRLYRRRGQMQSDEHARRFVFRAAINLARSHLRRRPWRSFHRRARNPSSPTSARPQMSGSTWLEPCDG
jgi:DNA-directed RNA polymerase specialized sigma24 family protein